jgi:uncharacterized protein YfiM (DUF2279 family)
MNESRFDNIIKVVVIANLLLLMFMSSAKAQNNTVLNLGIGDDKYMHFAAGTGVSMLAGCIFHDITGDLNKSVKFSLASGIGAGLTKELLDTREGGSGFNTPDLLFTAAGAVLGTYLTYVINKPRKRRR